ncbi:hypothetical protein C8Q77DRAFT_451414 [Trametes polyzona]|nr:hypothetical protein C8Q77DRAFT_451414 [Trametes polyzona]
MPTSSVGTYDLKTDDLFDFPWDGDNIFTTSPSWPKTTSTREGVGARSTPSASTSRMQLQGFPLSPSEEHDIPSLYRPFRATQPIGGPAFDAYTHLCTPILPVSPAPSLGNMANSANVVPPLALVADDKLSLTAATSSPRMQSHGLPFSPAAEVGQSSLYRPLRATQPIAGPVSDAYTFLPVPTGSNVPSLNLGVPTSTGNLAPTSIPAAFDDEFSWLTSPELDLFNVGSQPWQPTASTSSDLVANPPACVSDGMYAPLQHPQPSTALGTSQYREMLNQAASASTAVASASQNEWSTLDMLGAGSWDSGGGALWQTGTYGGLGNTGGMQPPSFDTL